MNDKFFNRAIIGYEKLIASLSKKGEILRACYPFVDGKQFIDYFKCGVKINDSNIIYLHDDINNKYSQNYINNTNVLVTNIKNTYFNLDVTQVDFVGIKNNFLIRKYSFINNNSIDLNISFLINSKINSCYEEAFGSRILDNGIVQYNKNYYMKIISNLPKLGHKLNDVQSTIQSGIINDKDYIGMSNEIGISFDVGILKPGQKKDFYVLIDINLNDSVNKLLFSNYRFDIDEELINVISYWENMIKKHSNISFENNEQANKVQEIYNRSILLFPLLINSETGGIAAALESDEKKEYSGGYGYCWPRDSIFITTALNMLKMQNETEKYYNIFCKKTQSENGMWEQRFFTNGKLAPCWGYQVDETASVIYGVYKHYLCTNNIEFLNQSFKMCEKAVEFLIEYAENILNIEEKDVVKKDLKYKYKKDFNLANQLSYDLWEMNEGIHLYSISSIIAAFESMIKIYEIIDVKNDNALRLRKEKRKNICAKIIRYCELLKDLIRKDLIDDNYKILKRNIKDNNMDISVIGAVYPFEIFDPKEKVVKNTVDKIDMLLRTYKGGYLRFEGDNYMGGNNPWVINTLWMALYYIKINEIKKAEECFYYVVNTACDYGFLSEQVNNEEENFKWIIGLGWSHAMYVIALNELIKIKKKI